MTTPPEVTGDRSASEAERLERRVKLYYEALGYRVVRNIRVQHHQIDLMASNYIPGAGTMSIMVECKYRDRVAGINEVTPFINTARHLIDSQ